MYYNWQSAISCSETHGQSARGREIKYRHDRTVITENISTTISRSRFAGVLLTSTLAFACKYAKVVGRRLNQSSASAISSRAVPTVLIHRAEFNGVRNPDLTPQLSLSDGINLLLTAMGMSRDSARHIVPLTNLCARDSLRGAGTLINFSYSVRGVAYTVA